MASGAHSLGQGQLGLVGEPQRRGREAVPPRPCCCLLWAVGGERACGLCGLVGWRGAGAGVVLALALVYGIASSTASPSLSFSSRRLLLLLLLDLATRPRPDTTQMSCGGKLTYFPTLLTTHNRHLTLGPQFPDSYLTQARHITDIYTQAKALRLGCMPSDTTNHSPKHCNN